MQMDLTVYDMKNHPKDKSQVHVYLMKHNAQGNIRVAFFPLRNDFAAFKNHLTTQCEGDYIFQIDADEMPCTSMIELLPAILEHNSAVDLYVVPRVNTVDGLTPEHVAKWGWNVNEKGWVNWPDYQTRIYKNVPEIKWVNKVHERLEGHKQFAYLPMEEDYSLYHPKTIDKQEKQNSYYDTL